MSNPERVSDLTQIIPRSSQHVPGGHWGYTKSSTFVAGDGKVRVVIRGPDCLGIVPSSGKWVSRPEEVQAVR